MLEELLRRNGIEVDGKEDVRGADSDGDGGEDVEADGEIEDGSFGGAGEGSGIIIL